MTDERNIILSHQTALSYWLHAESSRVQARPYGGNPLATCAQTAEEMLRFNSSYPGFGEKPMHVLVSERSYRRSSSHVVTHVCEVELPPSSFYRLSDNVFVVAPELCLAQCARSFARAALIEAVMNVVADYYVHPYDDSLPVRTASIATAQSIQAFISCASRVRGTSALQVALPHVLEHSRSPMETKSALLLTMPRKWGGYGLTGMSMNLWVAPGRQSQLVEQNSFCVDLAFSEFLLGIEYFGEECHQDPAKDRRRINGLCSLGWRIFTLDKRQLYDEEAFDKLAMQVAHQLNVRVQKSQGWQDKHRQLRFDLGLAPGRPGSQSKNRP